ncbi:lipoprotein NlpI [Gallaecimonas xiamenensis]|uniref:Lipoprotein NlpI n=1 Tax=Gallaecimonas xiamenensis 3-C-1 TaxID=745411 RepID=K2K9Q3_9GAMM|nr:lipoprotein NlpI [Gallaecimonas xiamenensis]EKE74040.1 lipoprotein NlpI [Gallaecimonas xiamenensis 3-C-1]
MRKTLAILIPLMLLAGCASTLPSQGASSSRLLLAEPLPIPFQAEVELARLEEILNRADLNDEQRAQILYRRGVVFDSVGLKALARRDFNRAVQLKPDMADAYNFLGIQAISAEEYEQAYEALDAAIELDPKHEYAYLNRGIALYYGDRPELAVRDLETFLALQPSDPYRILWLYLVEKEKTPVEAKARLGYNATKLHGDVWANQLVALYQGKLSEGAFIDSLKEGVDSNRTLAERLCEAYFYLGKLHQAQGDTGEAINFFKLALTTNVQDFIEYRYARLELMRMRRDLAQKAG